MNNDSEIVDFWRWFSKNAHELQTAADNPALVAEIDRRVSGLGLVAWEVGPGIKAEHSFVLSPGGSRDLMAKTTAIVASAPEVQGWDILAAKPPKGWLPNFTFFSELGQELQVDATNWHAVMIAFEDGALELVVEVPNLQEATAVDRTVAVEIIVDGLLGEARRIGTLRAIEGVKKMSRKERVAAFRLKDLLAYLPSATRA